MQDKEKFLPIYKNYLSLRGYDSEEDVEEIIDAVGSDTFVSFTYGNNALEAVNLMLFTDIVNGLWNKTLSTNVALYQLVNAVDIYSALKGFSYAGIENSAVSNEIQSLATMIDSVETEDDFYRIVDFIKVNKSIIPIQKDLKDFYIFLLLNMIHLIYFDTASPDFGW